MVDEEATGDQRDNVLCHRVVVSAAKGRIMEQFLSSLYL